MKKMVLLLLMIMLMAMSTTVSAKGGHHNWSNTHFDNGRWHQGYYERENAIPFKWHEHREWIPQSRYRMERIYDHRLYERFPGLHAYKWQDEDGFWYGGKHIKDAIMFYNDDDELVSVGFVRNGTFVFVRDDNRSYETHDDFFVSWLKILAIHEIVRS